MALTVSTVRTPPAPATSNGSAGVASPNEPKGAGPFVNTSTQMDGRPSPATAGIRSAATTARRADIAARATNTASEQDGTTQHARDGEPQRTLSSTARRWQSRAASFAQHHPKAVAYGATGLALAVLILLIGFWPTLLIALLAGIGVAIGTYRDGDATLHRFASQAASRLKH